MFQYTIKLLKKKIEEFTFDFEGSPNYEKRVNELKKVIKILREGTGYLGPCKTIRDGRRKVIFYRDM
ncbi:MAG: hypothetical protein ACXADW_16690 [Candidatus Hodarchaeales archaeon]|jgi:hypothetical protein